jgi:hypothetical protein
MPEQCAPASAREPPFDASAYELAVVSVGYGGCCSVRFPTSAGRYTGQRTSSDERVWRAGDADHPLGDWAGVGTVAPETNRWNPSVSLPETPSRNGPSRPEVSDGGGRRHGTGSSHRRGERVDGPSSVPLRSGSPMGRWAVRTKAEVLPDSSEYASANRRVSY